MIRNEAEYNMNCDWQQIADREYICVRCGKRIYVPQGYPNPPDFSKAGPCWKSSGQNTIQLALRYSDAMRRWIAAGRPVRSDERVQEIYDHICRPCEHFDSQRQTCKICGCRVRRSGAAMLNKIKMATERCPANPPKWIEEVG